MELIMENIRCFAGEHRIPVKPLTFLVGENSTGKTTFLAMLSTVLNSSTSSFLPRFNHAPYDIGNFSTLATSYGTGYSQRIKIGYRLSVGQIVATYINYSGQPVISELSIATPSGSWSFVFDIQSLVPTYSIQSADNNGNITEKSTGFIIPQRLFASGSSISDILIGQLERINKANGVHIAEIYEIFDTISHSKSIAPISIKPQRTYDEVTREFSPEGNDVPFVLQDVLNDPQKRGILERFGNESGLFSSLDLKLLQGGLGEPRQIAVTNVGQTTPVNLVDVGYGVSQVLPVLIQSILTSPETMLLLQQPEVHLHPRAQAALGTLFVDLVQQNKNQFVVETHSDYIIDRVRQEVAKGKIPAEDVSILYFERQGYEAKVYPIDLDENGNILNAPPTYRDFFLREEMNLLSR